MPEKDAMISFEEHKRQIEEYQKLFPFYQTYAKVLKGILEKACKLLSRRLLSRRVQGRIQFCRESVRKYTKYRDPVNQFTDLCGARVIGSNPLNRSRR